MTETESSPRSPLFAFSAPVSDDGDGDADAEEGSGYDEWEGEHVQTGLAAIPEEESMDQLLESELPEPEPESLDEEVLGAEAAALGSVSATSSPGSSGLNKVVYSKDLAGGSREQTAERDQGADQHDFHDDECLSPCRLSPLLKGPAMVHHEDSLVSQNLGKRTASDACLSDPEQDTEEKKMHRMSALSNESKRTSTSSLGIDLDSLAAMTTQTGLTSDSSSGGHSRRPSLIPRRVRFTSEAPSEPVSTTQPSEADDPHQGKTETGSASLEKENTDSILTLSEDSPASKAGTQLIVEELDTQSKVASDELLVSSDTDEETPSESDDDLESGSPTPMKSSDLAMPLTPTSMTDTVARDVTMVSYPKMEIDVEKVSETPKAANDDLLISLDTEKTPTKDDEDDDPGSPTPVKPTRFITPPTIIPAVEGVKKPSMPFSTGASDTESEPFQHVSNEPVLDWIDGILMVSNPPQASDAAYKIAITVSAHLQKGKLQGWNNLVIPGLPRVKNGESGYFLFQMPEGYGMEFRTTSFCRHRFVENCFFAEFANSGDLVIPLRVCDLFCIVKDFTVDQETIAEHEIHCNKPSVAYNAICSLRLHNRCFEAEKCCFFIDVEGGPEGFYECELDRPCTEFPVIYLASTNRPTGISHVQITCPPRILDMFCIAWDVRDLSRLDSKWLPRIYPGSTGVNGPERHFLRQKFIEFLTAVDYYEIVEAEDDDTVVELFDCPEQAVSSSDHGASQDKQSHDIPTERPSERLTSSKQIIILTIIVLLFVLFGLAMFRPTFDPLGPWSMDSTVGNATQSFGGDMGPNHINANEGYHLTNINIHEKYQSREDSTIMSETLDVDDTQQYETSTERAKVELKASPAIGDIEDIKPTEPVSGVVPSPSQLSLRDKVDYLLGWKGPTVRSRERKKS